MKRLFVVLIALLIPLFLLLASSRSTIFDLHFYEKEFKKNRIDVSDKEIIASNLISYLEHRSADESHISSFSSAEQSHLLDVKVLMQKGMLVFDALLVAMFLLFAFLLRKRNFKQAGIAMIFGGALAFLVIIILALFAKNFDFAFTRFHETFFTGNWQFPANSLLIKLFPEQFFADALHRIISHALICAAAITALGIVLAKRRK